MENNNIDTQSSASPNTFTGVILRFVTSAVILAITAFFTPGFTISNVWSLALAAVVLTVIDYLIVRFTGLHASAFGKGFVGFILAAVVLYVTPLGYFFLILFYLFLSFIFAQCIKYNTLALLFFYYLIFVFVYAVIWYYSSYRW